MLFGDPLPDMLLPAATYVRGLQWQGRVPVWGIWWFPVQGGGATSVQIVTRRGDLPKPMFAGTGQLQPVFGPRAPWRPPMTFAAVAGRVRDFEGGAMPDESLGVLASPLR